LPKHINEKAIIEAISTTKDVDGFHPINVWKSLIWDNSWFVSCTPAWIMEFFKKENIEFSWKNITVIWRSNIVWKPIVSLLINAWATVTSCNSKTLNLEKITKKSDIIIIAVWKPWLLKTSMVKHDAIIIDVWFTVIDWKIYWDADTKNIDLIWAKITPVPGWVWALTVAMLMKNTLKAGWIE
jgi:methylenetetrahydrofolate dehydrogenase (NADP+)/methenyltetrahydrofolate cyclohydrolase